MATQWSSEDSKMIKNVRDDMNQIEGDIRAMLSSLYVGTGTEDVGNVLLFLGIPWGLSRKNAYFKNSKLLNIEIIKLCESIIEEGMKMKIRATIKDKLDGQYSSDEISRYIDNFMNDDLDIPLQMLNVGIFVSYDIGWQKRSIGQI